MFWTTMDFSRGSHSTWLWGEFLRPPAAVRRQSMPAIEVFKNNCTLVSSTISIKIHKDWAKKPNNFWASYTNGLIFAFACTMAVMTSILTSWIDWYTRFGVSAAPGMCGTLTQRQSAIVFTGANCLTTLNSLADWSQTNCDYTKSHESYMIEIFTWESWSSPWSLAL